MAEKGENKILVIITICIILISIGLSGCVEDDGDDENNGNENKKLYDYYEVSVIINYFDNYSILLPVLPYTIGSLDYIESNISTNLKKSDISLIFISNVTDITEVNIINEKALKINFSENFTLIYKYEIKNVSCHGFLSLWKEWDEYYWTYLDSPNNYSVQIKLDTSHIYTKPEFQIIKKGWNIITTNPISSE